MKTARRYSETLTRKRKGEEGTVEDDLSRGTGVTHEKEGREGVK